MKNAFRKQHLAAAIAACMVPAVLAASESEHFSLLDDTGVQSDFINENLTGTYNGIPYEVIQGFAIAQGDIVLGKILPNGQLDVDLRPRGLGQASAFDRWADGIVPYQFSAETTPTQRERALEAIAHWNANTTLTVVERTAANADEFSDYINFELGGGCASYVGKIGGEQPVWLADNCTVGSIIHEIGHAMGLFHEHTRPDRDNFVNVNFQNVTTGKEINFETIDAGAANFSGYDYGSIMHYGEYFFSTNGEPTISPPDGVAIGQREALSPFDINSVNNMYATDLQLGVSTIADNTGTQIDVVVSNIGALGANGLEVSLNWGANVEWNLATDDSGWLCESVGAELSCTIDKLEEQDESLFSIQANANGAGEDELSVRVESRTLDKNLENNVFNDAVIEEESEAPVVTVAEAEKETVEPAAPAPTITAQAPAPAPTQVAAAPAPAPTQAAVAPAPAPAPAPTQAAASAPVEQTQTLAVTAPAVTAPAPTLGAAAAATTDAVEVVAPIATAVTAAAPTVTTAATTVTAAANPVTATATAAANTVSSASTAVAEAEVPQPAAAKSSGGGAALYLLGLLAAVRVKRRK